MNSIADFVEGLSDEERSYFAPHRLSGKFYVYILMRPNGSVFYIGKGSGYRMGDHEREAKRGVQSYKCNIIRKIWDEGGEVIKQKVAFFDKEEDAYELEILLINFFGRENLANKRDGGEGGSPGPQKEPEEYIPDKIDEIPDYTYLSSSRVLRLVRYLMNEPDGATRGEVYRAISEYQVSASESAQRRMFERDLHCIEKVGFSVIRNYHETLPTRYQIKIPS